MFGDTLMDKVQIGAGILLFGVAAAATYFYIRKKLRNRARTDEREPMLSSEQEIVTDEISPEALESGIQQPQLNDKLRSSPPSRDSVLLGNNDNDSIYYGAASLPQSQHKTQQKSLFSKAAGPQRRNVNGNGVNRNINVGVGDLDFGIYPAAPSSPPITVVVDSGNNDKTVKQSVSPVKSFVSVPEVVAVQERKEVFDEKRVREKVDIGKIGVLVIPPIVDTQKGNVSVSTKKDTEVKKVDKVDIAPVIEVKKEEKVVAPIIEIKKEEKVDIAPVIDTKKGEKPIDASIVDTKKEEKVDTPIVDTKKEEKPIVTPIVDTKKEEKDNVAPVIETKKEEKPIVTPIVDTKKEEKPIVTPIIEIKKEEKPIVTPIVEAKKEDVAIEEPKVVSDTKVDVDKEVEFKPKRHSSASPVKEKVEVPIEFATSVVKPQSHPKNGLEVLPPPTRPTKDDNNDASKSRPTSEIETTSLSVAARRKSFQFKPPTKPTSPKLEEQTQATETKPDQAAGSHILTHVKKAAAPQKRRPTRNPLKDRKQQEESGILSSVTVEMPPKATTPTPTSTASEAAKKVHDMKRIHKRAATMTLSGYNELLAARKAEAAEALRSGVTDDSDDYFKKKQEEKGLVLPRNKPRLFQVRGKKRPFVKQVELTWTSFHADCSYVLDTGKNGRFLYRWDGSGAGRIVKAKAMDFAKNLHDKERFNAKVISIAQGDETPEFFSDLCGKGASKPEGWDKMPKYTEDPTEAEKAYAQSISLKRIVYDEAAGTSTLEDLDAHGKSLIKSILNDKECFILDCGSEIYSWTPLKVKTKYKNEAVRCAEELAAKRREEENGTRWVAPVYNELAGEEQVMFRERFFDWNTVPIGVSAGPAVKFQKKELPDDYFNVDVAALYNNQSLVVPEDKKLATMVDSTVTDTSSSKITIFIVEEFKRIPIPPEDFGHFYSGETYVILYQYVWKNKDCHIIYFWQGKNSTVLGKGTSAALTKELDDIMKLNACMSLEVRVVQGKEPKHFVSLFGDKFIVHQGMDPHSSVGKPLDTTVPRMYHVEKKRLEYHISAVQTKTISSRILNSWNTFVLAVPADASKKKKEETGVEVEKKEEAKKEEANIENEKKEKEANIKNENEKEANIENEKKEANIENEKEANIEKKEEDNDEDDVEVVVEGIEEDNSVEKKVEVEEKKETVEIEKKDESETSSPTFDKSEGYAYVWTGRLTNEDEQKYGLSVVERLKSIMKIKNAIPVKEGEEPEEFWADIGGKFEYPTQTFTTRYYPRFYHCSVASGKYKVDEVVNFTQEDLEQNMAVIFDVYYAIYVWIGSKAHQLLRRHTFETAQNYLKHAASIDKRLENTPILRVQESEEPMVFSVYFQGWQMRPVKKGLPVPIQTYNNGLVSAEDVLKDYNRKYTYDDLVNKRYPPGLDESALENYLEDAEFESVFGCNKEVFNKLPSWKKTSLKRSKKLY